MTGAQFAPPPADALVGAVDAFTQLSGMLSRLARTPLDGLVGPTTPPTSPANLRRLADSIRTEMPEVLDRVDAAVRRAQRRQRFSPEGVGETVARIVRLRYPTSRTRRATRAPDEPDDASRILAVEFLGALGAGADEAARDLLARVVATGAAPEMTETLTALVRAIEVNDDRAAVDACRRLDDALAGVRHASARTHDALDFLAVLVALVLLGVHDDDGARERLAQRAAIAPSARTVAECCHLDLLLERLDDADAAARRAIDRGPTDVHGYVALGAVAESGGDLGEALTLYREGLAHADLAWLENPGAASMLAPTGLLLREIAPRLLDAGLPDEALETCREARAASIQGPERYPDRDAFLLEARILSARSVDVSDDAHRRELASAACEAGSRLLWSDDPGDLDEGVDQLTVATALATPDEQPLAGWLLAEALRRQSWARSVPPDKSTALAADAAWSSWAERAPDPSAADVWVYESGANISEDLALTLRRPIGATQPQVWEGLRRAERALELDPGDPDVWVLRARLLDAAELPPLARASVSEALALDPDHVGATVARVAHLTNDKHFTRALQLAGSLDADAQERIALLMAWLETRCGEPEAALARLAGCPESSWEPQARDMTLVSVHLALGRVPEALDALRSLLTKESFDVAADLRTIRAHALLGDVDLARRLLPDLDLPVGAHDAGELAATRLAVAVGAGDEGEALARVADVVPKLDSPRRPRRPAVARPRVGPAPRGRPPSSRAGTGRHPHAPGPVRRNAPTRAGCARLDRGSSTRQRRRPTRTRRARRGRGARAGAIHPQGVRVGPTRVRAA